MELVQGGAVEQLGPDRLWDLYRRSFPRRRRKAANQQAMDRSAFDTVIEDCRWTKLVLVERSAADPLAGMAALTEHTELVPSAAQSLIRTTWCQHVALGRLWYVPFLVVDPEYQHTGAAAHLAGGIWTRAVANGGIVMVDTAAFNDTAVRLPSALFHLARAIAPRSTLQQLDDDGLWAYEFPEPVLA
jgi:ribosomal protein S18 acetylase RimI-like enzyme